MQTATGSRNIYGTIVLFAGMTLSSMLSLADANTSYSPYANEQHATRVFWGDTHLHSSWSPDAGGSGNRNISPEQAYRFARGETVISHSGEPVALSRPLDFLVVADHSEAMGLFPLLLEQNETLLATANGERWANTLAGGGWGDIGLEFGRSLNKGQNPFGTEEARNTLSRTMWDRVTANADRFNQPGVFTAFIGYEWSSMPAGANLHRIVVFRDAADKAGKVLPFSSIDSEDPAELWRYLARYEKDTGGRVLAIPHNSNLSAGRMFETTEFDGGRMTPEYADTRRRWEPLVEATQIKGDSETAPFLSPEDEFADYGTWDTSAGMVPNKAHEDRMYPGEYVRTALAGGMAIANQIGSNPFEFGLIGSTDAHTGLATADDDNFWGKFSTNEPPRRNLKGGWADFDLAPDSPMKGYLAALSHNGEIIESAAAWKLVSSGYAAVWARENTREALFDAMRRRETYATTGPRMAVRFFGGWDFEEPDASAPDLARVGYAKGVPMGGMLSQQVNPSARPSFLVSVLRDPEGANLDRVQIIKVWADKAGQRKERIFDVAVSDARPIDRDGRCRTPVGNTVNAANATYTNTIGEALLSAVWQDPEFDPAQRAGYYVRALQIPTPRWSTYDAARLGVELIDKIGPSIQNRAYTSPIWYTPAQ